MLSVCTHRRVTTVTQRTNSITRVARIIAFPESPEVILHFRSLSRSGETVFEFREQRRSRRSAWQTLQPLMPGALPLLLG